MSSSGVGLFSQRRKFFLYRNLNVHIGHHLLKLAELTMTVRKVELPHICMCTFDQHQS